MTFPGRGNASPFTPGRTPAIGTDDPIHWRRRGAKLHAAGDHKGAAKAYGRYLSLPIRHPGLLAIATALGKGHLGPAEAMVRQYLTNNPDDPVAYRMFGQIALRGGSLGEAEEIFRRTLALVPGFTPVRFDLASALFLQGKFEDALEQSDKLLRVEPRNANYLGLRAAALGKLGDIAQSAAIYAALVKDHPKEPKLWVAYGNALRPLRRQDEAVAAFRRASTLSPEYGEPWWNLANLKTGALDAGDIAAIRAQLASDKPSPEDRYHLAFALARALEDAGDFGSALDAYHHANAERLRIQPEVPGVTATDRVERIIRLFTPEFQSQRAQIGHPSAEPVFILGMPRSGSTLLEQILASHPAVEGTQELPDLILLARDIDQSGRTGAGVYPEALAALRPDELHALGERYLAGVRGKRKSGAALFLDKQWANWIHVGLIALILPNAHIIDMRRDPVACCLSMYRQHFARGAAFTYSVEALAAEYLAYDRLMAHFGALMPGGVKRVELADLVADTETTIRAVLDHLGLPFAEECLRFFDSDRPVFTPSAEQVRRPINRDGDRLLEGFAPHLAEFRAALSAVTPAAARAGA